MHESGHLLQNLNKHYKCDIVRCDPHRTYYRTALVLWPDSHHLKLVSHSAACLLAEARALATLSVEARALQQPVFEGWVQQEVQRGACKGGEGGSSRECATLLQVCATWL